MASMNDSPLSQADLEEALRAAAEALQDASETFDEQGNQVAASDMHKAHKAVVAALSAPEGEGRQYPHEIPKDRWGTRPAEQQPDQVEAVESYGNEGDPFVRAGKARSGSVGEDQ